MQLNSKNLSDEDRKKNAENMILKIAALMDLEEGEEDEMPDPEDADEGWEAA